MASSAPVDLTKLSQKDFKAFIDSFDHVFSDCDGVIWQRSSIFPNAGEFFRLMKSNGKTVHFVSNNSLKSSAQYKAQFDSAKIENGVENLTHPAIAISEFLKHQNFTKTVFCVTCAQTKKTIEEYGFKCKEGPLVPENDYHNFIKYLEDDLEVGAVVFDSDFQVNLAKLYLAVTYLRRPDVFYLSGASDKLVPMAKGALTMGTGYFTEMVTEVTQRSPVQLGKPGKDFAEFAMKRAGVKDPSRVLFIGDMLEQDVGLGKNAGFKTLLLLTSNNYDKMMEQTTLMPDYFANTLGDIVPSLATL